jgi:hypothetical protein
MKKKLIPALLVVSAAFVPGLRNAVGFPDRVCEVAQEAARPLFWHLWDRLLARELAGGTEDRVRSEEPTWHAALPKDVVACILLDIILKHAFDGSLSVGEENNLFSVSISSALIRRTVERKFLPLYQHSAS